MNPNWLSVRNESTAPAAEIHINGFIGESWFDETMTSATQFKAAMAAIPQGRKVRLFVSSEGGSVKDGLEMRRAIAARSSDFTAVCSYALSIASYFITACGKVEAPPGSVFMLHKPWSGSVGNANDMRKAAQMLDVHESAMIPDYCSATGKTPEEMASVLDAETWMSGADAVAFGLVDELVGDPISVKFANIDARAQSRFRRMPVALGGTPPPPTRNNKETKMEPKPVTAEASAPAIAPTPPPKPEVDTPQAAALAKQVADMSDQFAKVNAQLAKERKNRITKTVDGAVAEGRIVVAAAPRWVERALADETVLDDLAAIPARQASNPPDSHYSGGTTVLDDYNALAPRSIQNALKRAKLRLDAFDEIRSAMRGRGGVMAANTISADLTPDSVSDQTILTLSNVLAPIGMFSLMVTPEPTRPKQTVQVPLVTAASTTLTNPSDWEQGNTTVTAAPVTANLIVQPFQISQYDANLGHTLERLSAKNAQALGNALSDIWTALILVGTYGAGTNIGSAANFDVASMPTILALAKEFGEKNLMLDGSYTARLQATNTLGFDWRSTGAFGLTRIVDQNRWTAATANTVGFLCQPSALAILNSAPVVPPTGQFDVQTQITIPGIDVVVQYTQHYNTATHIQWGTLSTMFGAAAGEAAAGKILLSA